MWVQKVLRSLLIDTRTPSLRCDNQSAIAFSRTQDLSERSKHIDIKYFFVRDYLLKGDGYLTYHSTDSMVADPLTKALPTPAFLAHRSTLLRGLADSAIQGEFVDTVESRVSPTPHSAETSSEDTQSS